MGRLLKDCRLEERRLPDDFRLDLLEVIAREDDADSGESQAG